MRWFGRRDRDYREELETHIEMEVRENLDGGIAPNAARQAALRTFGNALVVRERLQEARPLRFWEVLLRDARYGTRLLMRTPALTATIVLTQGGAPVALQAALPVARRGAGVGGLAGGQRRDRGPNFGRSGGME